MNGDSNMRPQYQELLQLAAAVLVFVRARLYVVDPLSADLLDAIENIPALLASGANVDLAIVDADLSRIEAQHPELGGRFTKWIRGSQQAGD